MKETASLRFDGSLREDLRIQQVIAKDREGDAKPIRIYLTGSRKLRKPSEL
jgi:hypothetical protein